MSDWKTRVSPTIRRLGAAIALAFVLDSAVAFVSEGLAAFLFLPLSIAAFFAWPHIRGKLNYKFPKSPVPRPRRSTAWGRLVMTGLIAYVLTYTVALLEPPAYFILSGPLLWAAMYYGWPHLRVRLPFRRSSPTPPSSISASKPPLWRRAVRGVFALTSAIMVPILLMAMIVIVPLAASQRRAQKVHDSIHVGMTVPQVLATSRDCDVFQASSEFPYDKANREEVPAMGLSCRSDGSYSTYDGGRDLSITDAQAIERLHTTLHDGYNWRFHYTYVNVTPLRLSFDVVFDPDGRVCSVEPIYRWD